MTNFTILGLTLLIACTTEPARPPKVYDFAAASLDDLQQIAEPTGPLSKATVRHAIQGIQPRLLACYRTLGRGATGTLELQLRLIGDPDGTLVESANLGGDPELAGNALLVDCMQRIVMTIELPPMPDPADWYVTYPFRVGTSK